MIYLLFFLSTTLAGTLSLKLKNQQQFPVTVKLNNKSISMKLSEVNIGNSVSAGNNDLTVCFSNVGQKTVSFPERTEAQIRLQEKDTVKLLRVINYRGRGKNCISKSFFLTGPAFAQLDRGAVIPTAVASQPAPPAVDPTLPPADQSPAEPELVSDMPTVDSDTSVAANSSEGVDGEPTLTTDAAPEPDSSTDGTLEFGDTDITEIADSAIEASDEIAMNPPEDFEQLADAEPLEVIDDEIEYDDSIEELPEDFEMADMASSEGYEVIDETASEVEEATPVATASTQSLTGGLPLADILGVLGLLYLLFAIGLSRIFAKLGIPNWKAFVPVINFSELVRVSELPSWHTFAYLVPVLNLPTHWRVCLHLANCFAKPKSFAIGLCLAPFVFFPLLGLQKDEMNFSDTAGEEIDGEEATAFYQQPIETFPVDESDNATSVTEIADFDEATRVAT